MDLQKIRGKQRLTKSSYKIVLSILMILVLCGVSYALFSQTLFGQKKYSFSVGELKIYLEEETTENISLTDVRPVTDETGKTNPAYRFSLVNEDREDLEYTIYLKEEEFENKTPTSAVRYQYTRNIDLVDITRNMEESKTEEGRFYLESGIIPSKTTYQYEFRMWIDINAGNEIMGTEYSLKIQIDAVQTVTPLYKESVLNGCDPVLSENLVPIIIENNGTVKKASIHNEWYNYSKQEWANAVVLEDKTLEYSDGEVIPEANIQSYFVWIPKYRYQLWDLGNYNGATNIDNTKVHSIPIQFGKEDTNDSKEGECTTPAVSESSGNCKVGDYMTHPAFQAFGSNGFWVGKFESGYKGATTTAEAQQNNSDYSKLVIKPNVYSWRNITVGNAFKASYDYLREDESHMIKNTEWGAVAYLQHSEYGSRASVRVNNNYSHMTGYASINEPTCGYNDGVSIECNQNTSRQLYNTTIGYDASTTRNITGIYDMSGGAHEYVMGYAKGTDELGAKSEITSNYEDFFTAEKWNKYYDCYPNITNTMYRQRILGDATGEMGPFGTYLTPSKVETIIGSWYNDSTTPMTITLGEVKPAWFFRGGNWTLGNQAGIFFYEFSEGTVLNISFRVVLTP